MHKIAKIIAVAALGGVLAGQGEAMAFGRGGSFHGGGFHGGFYGGRPGFRAGVIGYPWWGYGYGYPYYYYPDWYPDYGVPYAYPPAEAPYSQQPGVAYGPSSAPPNGVPHGVSRYCATPARICVLPHSAAVGASCQCRVAGGFSPGRVAPQ